MYNQKVILLKCNWTQCNTSDMEYTKHYMTNTNIQNQTQTQKKVCQVNKGDAMSDQLCTLIVSDDQ